MPRVDNNNVKGKLAFIIDASGAIGAATARSLLLRDVDLALHYESDTLAIEDLVAQLRHDYDTHVHPAEDRFLRITTHRADVSSVEGCVGLLEDVRKVQGRPIDILVFNSSTQQHRRDRPHDGNDIGALSVETFEAAFYAHLRAAFVLTQRVVDGMKKSRWGRIVYVSSAGVGRTTDTGGVGTAEAVVRGGLMGLMGDVSVRSSEWEITANGVIAENIEDTVPDGGTAGPGQGTGMPLARMGTPQEVANVVVMFVTTGYITGQTVTVAGASAPSI